MSDRYQLPGFWMNEASGRLQPAMRRYLNDRPMSARDILLVRAYLKMWIDAPWECPMLDVLRTQVEEITTAEDISRWLERAARDGIDPI